MKAIAVNCSACGGKLQPTPGASQITCTYCGTVSQLHPERGGAARATPTQRVPAWIFAVPVAVALVIGGGAALWWSLASIDDRPAAAEPPVHAEVPPLAPEQPVRVLRSPSYSSCLVDTNGDGVLDLAGIYAWTDQPSTFVVSAIDGASGARLWRGPEVRDETTLLCGHDGQLAVDTPDFKLQLHAVGRAERITYQLGDRVNSYAAGDGCYALTLANEELVHVGYDGKPVASCEGPRFDVLGTARTHPSASKSAFHVFGDDLHRSHDDRRFRSSQNVWLGAQDGIIYMALTAASGTPFITVTARRGEPPFDLGEFQDSAVVLRRGDERREVAARGQALLEALDAMPEVWSVRLAIAGDPTSQRFRAVLTPSALIVYGEEPGAAAPHRLVGVGVERGAVRHTVPLDREAWSLFYNGRYVISDGLGNHSAFDPSTGERVW